MVIISTYTKFAYLNKVDIWNGTVQRYQSLLCVSIKCVAFESVTTSNLHKFERFHVLCSMVSYIL